MSQGDVSQGDASQGDVSAPDPALVRGLEERCFNAWPALRTLIVDGWALRLSDGHTRRNNSASPLWPSSMAPSQLLDLVETTFHGAGLRPIVRLTPLAGPGVEAALIARGYVDEDATFVMGADDAGGEPVCAAGVEVRLSERLEDAWIDKAMNAYGHGEKGARALRRSLPLIVPAHVYATVLVEGRPLAFGLAVAERGWTGLYDLVVDPAARGQGLGSIMVAALRRWGGSQGAPRGYLQVRADNSAARNLYARCGFRGLYRYGNYARPA